MKSLVRRSVTVLNVEVTFEGLKNNLLVYAL